jgi:hypothetical protein
MNMYQHVLWFYIHGTHQGTLSDTTPTNAHVMDEAFLAILG